MNRIKQYFQDKRGKKSAVKRYTRSKAGNFALVFFLVAGGLFSMLPLIYCVCTSFKPLDELLIFPPRFFVHRPTIGNYTILPDLMASLKVPLSRYIVNSVGISFFTTFIYIFVALMAAYAISKGTFKGRNAIFWTVQFALMFNSYTLAVPQYLIFSKLGLIDTYWIYILPPMASTMGVFLGKQYIEGYVPDAFQKNLVIVPGEENKIVFVYTVDTENAPYQVIHYFQNTDGQTWTIEYSYSGIAAINSTYTENPMTGLVGFVFDPSQSKTSGVITADGLVLELYYTRLSYPYQVVYKVQSTGEVLYKSEIYTDLYGKVVYATAPATYDIYSRVSAESQEINIRVEASQDNPTVNVITFFYKEIDVTLHYVIVAPDNTQYNANTDWGKLSVFSESLKQSTGIAIGSTATAIDSVYKFVGWYDANGTLLSDKASYVPTKGDEAQWVDGTTYYAKFEYNLTSLTINKEGWVAADKNQTFIFKLVDEDGLELFVTIHGNGSVTIDGLTVGKTYRLVEVTSWSWRYEYSGIDGEKTSVDVTTTEVENGIEFTLNATGNVITFENTRKEDKWLDGDSWCDNIFKN